MGIKFIELFEIGDFSAVDCALPPVLSSADGGLASPRLYVLGRGTEAVAF